MWHESCLCGHFYRLGTATSLTRTHTHCYWHDMKNTQLYYEDRTHLYPPSVHLLVSTYKCMKEVQNDQNTHNFEPIEPISWNFACHKLWKLKVLLVTSWNWIHFQDESHQIFRLHGDICCVSIKWLHPSEDPAYTLCKGCVLRGPWESGNRALLNEMVLCTDV